ncbi:UDP-2-acetamido-2,6-beta-L-arabino-hexul-4-ose reductase [Solibacillus kalamii]|uniref:Capsular biosynthesis protein n=1 Tax=Solibacillus kalamii TaxID=1748298 RepID=A0ABX3ZLN5_9BACL|nr:NAD-dependent epimerase/dehydratase family protein [Solibacillus kalamii]MBM7665254.1 UDP-2-acetamido-2,6-beta-L-arabino-hexul-4-ose reductase [Solibacillus kalamii]OUZ40387.1 capsular biosynthesis protein [Solibacillus kalamii]
MKVLITGSKGFIGKNLIATLQQLDNIEILTFNKNDNREKLDLLTQDCDFVFHLAGVNRPIEEKEYIDGNYGFTSQLINSLTRNNNNCPILFTSSSQAILDNLYGSSKKAAEEEILKYRDVSGAKVLIYRLPNVFGKWSKPNYNSAIATFCYNISRGLPITVSNPNIELMLVYIDDVINEFINALNGNENYIGDICEVPIIHKIKLGAIVDLINSFKNSRQDLSIPDMANPISKKLYSTYLSYLPENDFSYKLNMNIDHRGSFTEFIKTSERGQVSVNISQPGITKGNHWHHTKNEKFLVVSGRGVIRLRRIDTNEVIEYYVSGDKLEVVDIPIGYTHNIENLGCDNMVTIMWANEYFNPNIPDTYYLEV